MKWRRITVVETPVSVNARLARLSTTELYEHAEAAIMMAGYHLAQWRTVDRVIDGTHLDQAAMQIEWALEALRALRDR